VELDESVLLVSTNVFRVGDGDRPKDCAILLARLGSAVGQGLDVLLGFVHAIALNRQLLT